MHFNGNNNVVLVAPRPVRLPTTAYQPHAVGRSVRLLSTSTDPTDNGRDPKDVTEGSAVNVFLDSSASLEIDSSSPRAPSRSGLSSEALEEFLSILTPSSLFTAPSSPIFRSRHHRGNSLTLSSLPCERSPQLRALHDVSNSPSPVLVEGAERQSNGIMKNINALNDNTVTDTEMDGLQPGSFGGVLSSPVSRWQTRNPFYRHPSYGTSPAFSHASSVSPAPISISPAAVPLPSPSPSELDLA